jgi:hypothetical protein
MYRERAARQMSRGAKGLRRGYNGDIAGIDGSVWNRRLSLVGYGSFGGNDRGARPAICSDLCHRDQLTGSLTMGCVDTLPIGTPVLAVSMPRWYSTAEQFCVGKFAVRMGGGYGSG